MTLDRPRFSTTSLREGYDMQEVDQAIDLIFENLELAEPRFGAERITDLRFTPVRLRQGYDIGEVDTWLDLAAAETARRASGGAPPEQAPPVPGPAPEAQPHPQAAPQPVSAPQPQAAPARSSYEPTRSSAITEVSSGGPALYLILVAILVVVGVIAYALFA
ncbi:DivIVA domain-containing protein [Nocardioides exalbidus]|uniref:DivIVA domain-containing protein n=1 Tax=Nocardioides exalbidus TaxID=402596 RepID=A0A1H4KT93_9ACTN|nr:DivIVA domain-containing protein [Nocardioides exalbidus]SEB61132.1 DivIVA domain-containing protein [Nocardioides exalbidus]